MRLTIEDGLVLIELDSVYRVASTLPSPPNTSVILFLEVPRNAIIDDFERFVEIVAQELGVENPLVFLTAARLPQSFHLEILESRSVRLTIAATVGLSPLACTRMELHEPIRATINIAVVVHEPGLRPNAAIDLIATIASAKTNAVHLTRPVCSNGRLALGTVTDAVAVLYKQGSVLYAGPATTIGGVAADAIESIIVREWLRGKSQESLGEEIARNLEGIVRAYRVYYRSVLQHVERS